LCCHDPPPPCLYPLSLHDALPICHMMSSARLMALNSMWASAWMSAALPWGLPSERCRTLAGGTSAGRDGRPGSAAAVDRIAWARSEEHTSELQSRENLVCRLLLEK